MNETEKELVAMVLAGRPDAFEPLVTPYRRPLLALAWRLTRDAEEARDVAQEALLRAYRSLAGYDTGRSFRNWLFQIAANEARDRYRRKARETAAFGAVAAAAPPTESPEAGRERGEVRSDILRALAVLSPREREVLVLRDLEELDVRETARTLGCSAVAVRVHLSKARRKLRDVLRRDLPHLEVGR
ncbi:MAG: sigma-70 family RNA polymerase sigma factor [Candidatus Aminicenantes bacterium]|nr:sigma-70 family RNA polymerase sigma factor [Candidatus Aminicenantes bacterium]NLH75736.1 sigma-70 family RNA polymerase sigma factor [Acidobacteriota bacterium]